ncbi:MAG: hypothetical protein JWN86_2616 [Planctomycetota bacterium]|nr:hypothetical protein [Planctomycetota bacterium]
MPALTSVARRPRRIRKRTIFAVFCGLVVLAGLAGFLYLGWATSRQLRNAMAEADRLDPGWRFPELEAKRAVIPDAENSALQVGKVLTLMPAVWPPIMRRANPTDPGSVEFEADLLTRIGEIPPNVRLGEPLAAELRQALAAYPEAIAQARKLAEMPRGRFQVVRAANPMLTLLPHLQAVRDVARFIQTDAILRAHDGDIDGALESCRAILNVGRSIGDEPSVISQIVRIAIPSVSMNTAQRVLAQGQASEAALAKFQARLVEESRHSFLLAALRGERASNHELMTKLTIGELNVASINKAMGTGLPTMPIPGSGAFFQYNHALILNHLNHGVELGKLPDEQQLDGFKAWEEEFTAPMGNGFIKTIRMLNYLLMPAIAAVGNAQLRLRGTLASHIALIASERHRLAHGTPPVSMDKIDPKFAVGIFDDPYLGRPVRFRIEAGRINIYSVGPDRQDNGGTFDPRSRPIAGTDQGWTWWLPPSRRLPPTDELPRDVFQKMPPGDQTEPLP